MPPHCLWVGEGDMSGGGGDQELWVGPGTRERRGSDQLLCGCEGVLLAAGTNVLGSWVGTGGLL